MEEYFTILSEYILFKDIPQERFPALLKCLSATTRNFLKHQTIRDAEVEIKEAGVVVKGEVLVTKINLDGSRTILRNILPGRSFGDSIAFAGIKHNPLIITAATDCTVVFFPARKLIANCENPCELQFKVRENLVRLLAQKNVELHIKNDILSKRSLRDKLLAFFYYEADYAGSYSFKLHFKLEELADYLGVNRSAMSRELGKMKEEGIIYYSKGKFVIKDGESDIRFK